MLQTRTQLPTAFNGAALSLSCWTVERGSVCPLWPPKNEKKTTTKSIKKPQSIQNPDISPRFLMISSVTRTRREGKKAIPSLPGDVYMLTWRMDALAVRFVQFRSAFKKI